MVVPEVMHGKTIPNRAIKLRCNEQQQCGECMIALFIWVMLLILLYTEILMIHLQPNEYEMPNTIDKDMMKEALA